MAVNYDFIRNDDMYFEIESWNLLVILSKKSEDFVEKPWFQNKMLALPQS